MGEKNGHYCVDGQMWGIRDDGYPTLIHKSSTLNIAKALLELFRDSDMRPEDECHVLYDAAEEAVAKECVEVTSLRARVEKLEACLALCRRCKGLIPCKDCPNDAALAGCGEVERG